MQTIIKVEHPERISALKQDFQMTFGTDATAVLFGTRADGDLRESYGSSAGLCTGSGG